MTKEQKKAAEASKPLEERNYWHLSKSEKSLWLSKKGLNKFQDVVIPILMPFIGLAAIILAVVMMVLTLKASDSSIMGGGNKTYWLIAEGIISAIGLGVGIWQFIDMGKKKKGWFINQYYSGDRSGVERMHEEIDSEAQISDANSEANPADVELDL